MKRIVGIGVVAVAAVVAAFWIWRSGGDKAEPPPSEQVTPSKPVVKPPPRRDREPRDDRPRDRELAFLTDDDPAGNLRLEGQVVDRHNAGVGGARVILNTNPPRFATTENDGSFYFDQLVGRRYEVQARAAQGVAGPITARLNDLSEPVVLRLRAAGAVDVEVIDGAENRPVSGATVELRDLDTQTATTDSDGKTRITHVVPGRYRLVAYAPGYARQHTSVRVFAETPAGVKLALRAGAPVTGRVVTRAGEPVAGASVLYDGASDWAQQADPQRDAARSDDQGSFRFDALPAGTFRFTARHPDHAPGSSELITLDGSTEQTGVEIQLEPAALLRGKVVSVDGARISSARVRVAVKLDGFFNPRPRQSYTDEDGEFEIRGLPRAELELLAAHDTGTSEIVAVDMRPAPHERELTLTLTLTDAISGVVVDTEGEPVEGAQVSAFPDWERGATFGRASWRLRGIAQELTNAGGEFTLRGLKPGPYGLRANPPGSDSRTSQWLREPTPANTGDSGVKIVLEADGEITGKVAFKSGEAPAAFSISMGGFGAATPFSTRDGSFAISDLPPKTYSLIVSGPGFDTRKLTGVKIAAGESQDVGTITVRQGRYIAGRVLKDGQPVPEALVRAGRQVFGDGSSSKSERGGPPGARSAKEATTDETGSFRITGIGEGDLFVVAEHNELGRSPAIMIRRSPAPVQGLELGLEPFGALQGKVSKNGEPVPSVAVSALSQTAPGVQYGVSTGQDGTFRFDRLAPDTYRVQALSGLPFTGMGFHAEQATVASNQTATVNLTMETGPVTLKISLNPTNADKVNFAYIMLVEGALTAQTVSELQLTMAQLSDRYSNFSFAFGGRPATVRDLRPGSYTACAIPSPNELNGMQESMEYQNREGDRLPAICEPVTVTETPEEQAVTIDVEVPAYIPGPDEGEGE